MFSYFFAAVVSCGNPGTPKNSLQSGSVFTYRAAVKYTCAKGHEKTAGDSSRTCQADKTWTNKAIVCTGNDRLSVELL